MLAAAPQGRDAPAAQPPRVHQLCGFILAAGAGTRFGGPKALARQPDGTPWLELAARMLTDAGCDRILVGLGAGRAQAVELVPDCVTIVEVRDWADGISATVRAGLRAASATDAEGLVITPVDTPSAPAEAVRRLCTALATSSIADGCAQAVYSARPGHPVLIGRRHWPALIGSLAGDRGARRQLEALGVLDVECGDLWDGRDVDVSSLRPSTE